MIDTTESFAITKSQSICVGKKNRRSMDFEMKNGVMRGREEYVFHALTLFLLN